MPGPLQDGRCRQENSWKPMGQVSWWMQLWTRDSASKRIKVESKDLHLRWCSEFHMCAMSQLYPHTHTYTLMLSTHIIYALHTHTNIHNTNTHHPHICYTQTYIHTLHTHTTPAFTPTYTYEHVCTHIIYIDTYPTYITYTSPTHTHHMPISSF